MFFGNGRCPSCELAVRLAGAASDEHIDELLRRQLAALATIELTRQAALGRRDIDPEVLWEIENLILHDSDVGVLFWVCTQEGLIGNVRDLNIK